MFNRKLERFLPLASWQLHWQIFMHSICHSAQNLIGHGEVSQILIAMNAIPKRAPHQPLYLVDAQRRVDVLNAAWVQGHLSVSEPTPDDPPSGDAVEFAALEERIAALEAWRDATREKLARMREAFGDAVTDLWRWGNGLGKEAEE